MGFRSTFTTEDYHIEWPQWFREKYQETVYVPDHGPLASKMECKTYWTWSDLLPDIQQAIDWDKQYKGLMFVLLFLHECGGITRVEITKETIRYSEPSRGGPPENVWDETDNVEHSYCYGCSDLPKRHSKPIQGNGNDEDKG